QAETRAGATSTGSSVLSAVAADSCGSVCSGGIVLSGASSRSSSCILGGPPRYQPARPSGRNPPASLRAVARLPRHLARRGTAPGPWVVREPAPGQEGRDPDHDGSAYQP